MNVFEYRISEKVYDWMKNGTKRIEVRLYNEKAQKINIGDKITFTTIPNYDKSLNVKVTGLLRYSNIFDLYEDFDTALIADKRMTKEEINHCLEEIFGKEEIEKYDILGIKFELLDN